MDIHKLKHFLLSGYKKDSSSPLKLSSVKTLLVVSNYVNFTFYGITLVRSNAFSITVHLDVNEKSLKTVKIKGFNDVSGFIFLVS